MQKSSGSNNQDVKQKNRMLVLKLITVNKGVSRVDIAKMTGLSKMTVGNIVTELIEQGIVTEKTCRIIRSLKTMVIMAENLLCLLFLLILPAYAVC